MKKLFSICVAMATSGLSVWAQKPFTEGTIHYKVRVEAGAGKVVDGSYTFTIKNGRLRKDIQLSNGYQDVLIVDCDHNTAYSLQTFNGKKYAIQLTVAELTGRQQKYAGYTLREDKNTGRIIAGLTANKGELTYPDGTHFQIYFSNEWYAEKGITYERFPDARFLPLSYAFVTESNITMYMEADKVTLAPVENSLFRVPGDYKIISNSEYKQLKK